MIEELNKHVWRIVYGAFWLIIILGFLAGLGAIIYVIKYIYVNYTFVIYAVSYLISLYIIGYAMEFLGSDKDD